MVEKTECHSPERDPGVRSYGLALNHNLMGPCKNGQASDSCCCSVRHAVFLIARVLSTQIAMNPNCGDVLQCHQVDLCLLG